LDNPLQKAGTNQKLNLMKHFIPIIILAATLISCTEKKEKTEGVISEEAQEGLFIGERIIYDMLIKNVDPEDEWTEECLRQLDRNKLVSLVFDAVYSRRLVPYDYFSDEELSLSDIRTLEKDPEFSRDRIGKLQFRENWYFDEQKLQLNKQVNYLLMAYEVYNSNGELRGYKPAFYVLLN
jgi:hypothetical protein